MKKNLTFIAIAAAMLVSCGSSDKSAEQAATVQATKPNVKIATVTTEAVEQLEEFTTTVEAEVKNNIIPNSPLRIERILVEVGDYVRKGQKLVQLDASNLDQLKLQYENQLVDFKRVEELYKVGGTSKAEYDNAKTQIEVSKRQLDNRLENTVLVSPINGVVSARNYDNGDMYGGTPILVVEQISPVKMKINISESRYAQTNRGLDVKLNFATYGEQDFDGKISIVYPTIDPATHTFPVEITLANSDMKVRPGMYGKATVNFGTTEHVVVPDAAVIKQTGSGDYYVYTYDNGKVTHNKVQLGRRLDNRYELISGIEPGSKVVVAGQNALSNGMEVEVIK
ncbi:MAG: efflux RND transporter periplasmic adaptor subunit [Bacteroidaceae bacterium]|nr:efflux RND transporter periplasmic adaptor subunit [Bacteroidaceae bacterium]